MIFAPGHAPSKGHSQKRQKPLRRAACEESFRAYRLAATVLTVKALMAFGTVSMAPTTVPVPMNIAVPVRGRTPVPTCPHPMVIAPSPITPDPNVTGRRAYRQGLDNRSRHGWLHTNRGRCYDDRCRNRDSKVDSETNPGICSGDSQCSQGQNCDSLFHNIHLSTQFDALAEQNIVTTGLLICKKTDPQNQTDQTAGWLTNRRFQGRYCDMQFCLS
jgi:hypothetical protein